MKRPIIARGLETANNTDILSGTELNDCPNNGFMELWIADTDDQGFVEIPQDNHRPSVVNDIPLKTNGTVTFEDIPYIIPVTAGVRPKIVLTGTQVLCNWCARYWRD